MMSVTATTLADTLSNAPPPEPDAHGSDGYVHRPVTNSLHDLAPTDADATLTPLRAHYLKKSLISLQFAAELNDITNPSASAASTLSYLGPPFAPPPKGSPPKSFPFLRFMFNQFILTFPFLATAPKDFFPVKLQPFLASLMSQNLGASETFDDVVHDQDADSRRRLLEKVEKNLSLLLIGATKLVEQEEVVRLTQRDLDRLEALAKRQQSRRQRSTGLFDVNIVCVRTVSEKGRIRSKIHEEFLIRTRRKGLPDIFVSRRYGDFKTLSDELRKAHPEEEVKPPPSKDKTTVIAPTSPGSSSPIGNWSPSLCDGDAPGSPPPLSRSNTVMSASSSATVTASRLAREKNRLTLRSYLHSMLSGPTLASSPVLKSFLLSSPTRLSRGEEEDARRREEADQLREEGRRQFVLEVAARVDGLRGAITGVKHDILSEEGLARVLSTIKATPDSQSLPADYKAVLEWGRISLAATIFQTFIASDSGSETLTNLKRIHGLIPYLMLRGILKISNPVGMIRGVLDLFLAQPFGGRSLLQRMFTTSLSEEVKALQEDIQLVEGKVEDAEICQKVRQFVYADSDVKAVLRADAVVEKQPLWTIVLRAADEPKLSRTQMQRVGRATRAYQAYLAHRAGLADSDDDDGPQDDDAWLFEDLTVLAKLYSRLRDKEQLIALIFEGSTSDLLKDCITIFYAPLATVYKAANIADSLGDLQTFINDLIRTVDQVENSGTVDPQRAVQVFIDLVQRHEQAFYSFVHKVHSKGEQLFDSLMRWISLFLGLIRDGLGEKISLEFILPHTGEERREILAEVDAVAVYHYKLKLAYEDKMRRRFAKNSEQGQEDDAATQAIADGFVADLNLGDLVETGPPDLEDDDDQDDSDDSDESDDDTDDTASTADPEHAGSVSHKGGPTRASLELPAPSKSRGLRPSRSFNLPRRRDVPGENAASSVPPLPTDGHLPLTGPTTTTSSSSGFSKSPASALNLKTSPPQPKSFENLKQKQPSPRPKKRNTRIEIKHPELHALPRLLPLFIELMRPHLAPRTT